MLSLWRLFTREPVEKVTVPDFADPVVDAMYGGECPGVEADGQAQAVDQQGHQVQLKHLSGT